MTESVLDVLDDAPTGDEPRAAWLADVERSLAGAPDAWVEAVGSDGLSQDRSWVLLAWVEDAASQLVRERRRDLVELAAFAMSLLEAGPLDRRDVMVVAMLVRRGSTLAGIPFEAPVSRGCARAGELGRGARSGCSGSPTPRPPPTTKWARAATSGSCAGPPRSIPTHCWRGSAGSATTVATSRPDATAARRPGLRPGRASVRGWRR